MRWAMRFVGEKEVVAELADFFELYVPEPDTVEKRSFSDAYIAQGRLEKGQLVSVSAANYGSEGPPINTYENNEVQTTISPSEDLILASARWVVLSAHINVLDRNETGYLEIKLSRPQEIAIPISDKYADALRTGSGIVAVDGQQIPGRGAVSIPGTAYIKEGTVTAFVGNPYIRFSTPTDAYWQCSYKLEIPYFVVSGSTIVLMVNFYAKTDQHSISYDSSWSGSVTDVLASAIWNAIKGEVRCTLSGIGQYSELAEGAPPPAEGYYYLDDAVQTYSVVNEDCPDEESLDRYAKLVCLEKAPKEWVEIHLSEDEAESDMIWPGDTIKVGSYRYLVDEISYESGWYIIRAFRPLLENIYVFATKPTDVLAEAVKNKSMKIGSVISASGSQVTVQTPLGQLTLPRSKVVVQGSVAYWR